MKRKHVSNIKEHNIPFYKTIKTEPSILINILSYFKLGEIEYIYKLLYYGLNDKNINDVLEDNLKKNLKHVRTDSYINFILKKKIKSLNFNVNRMHMFDEYVKDVNNFNHHMFIRSIIGYGLCKYCKEMPSPSQMKNFTVIKNYNIKEYESPIIFICEKCIYQHNPWLTFSDTIKLMNSSIDQTKEMITQYYIRYTIKKRNSYEQTYMYDKIFKKDIDERIIVPKLRNELLETNNKINEIIKYL